MTWSQADTYDVLKRLKQEEGFEAKVYLDGRGNKTIGYGTLLEDGITEEEATFLLQSRLNAMIRELESSSVDETFQRLPNGVAKAIVDMAYNMGVPRLMGFTKMWRYLSIKSWSEAALECLDSEYARELPQRAARNAAVIKGGL